MDKTEPYNLNLLRGWQRSQLKLLKEFATNVILDQTMLSGASGMPAGSHALGGKLTALTRSGLIMQAGKDDNDQSVWQLNEKRVDKTTLLDLLNEMKI